MILPGSRSDLFLLSRGVSCVLSSGMLAVTLPVSRAACILRLSDCRVLPHQVLVPALIPHAFFAFSNCLFLLIVLPR